MRGAVLQNTGLVTEYGLCGIGYWNFMAAVHGGFALLNAVFRLEP